MATQAPPKTSLAARTPGALSTGFKLPDVFKAPEAPLEGRVLAPYVTFAHSKRADEWKKIQSKFPNVTEMDMFLVEPSAITYLPTLKTSLLACRKYYAAKDGAGKTLATSPRELPGTPDRPKGVGNEMVEAVLFVYLTDRATPATVTFKTTKCGGVVTLSEALVEASTPEWLGKSEAHKATAVCTEPFMRFYGELTVQPPRVGKQGGNPYRPCVCLDVKPTGPAEWKLIGNFFGVEQPNAENMEVLNLCVKRFQMQCADIDRLAVK